MLSSPFALPRHHHESSGMHDMDIQCAAQQHTSAVLNNSWSLYSIVFPKFWNPIFRYISQSTWRMCSKDQCLAEALNELRDANLFGIKKR